MASASVSYRSCRALIALLALSAIGLASTQQLPSWTAQILDPNKTMGGAAMIPGSQYVRLYEADPVVGTYSHGAMIDYHDGMFAASWKCSPSDEDQAGQRVLYAQSIDGLDWTAPAELFPNVSTSSNPAHLFAEPFLHLNGRTYAAASPTQFCLYPDQYQNVLLLRRVFTEDVGVFGQLGPIFWASITVPAGVYRDAVLPK